ncbi:unnamed protein product [Rotaria sp. Silwood1]|nr:unnamed protein product [Rotaria sp. Silwood1]
MANQKSPGGGYRRGDGAQEENLLRRSNYCLSLDVEMDESNRSERFHCAADGQLKQFFKADRMYPMEEFGAVYTSGITVFRHSEDRGYAFLDEPVYEVCAIAMAAYREPKLDKQMLTGTAAAGMRKKIENIFAIAYHQNHDCLVLSALGCGAFKNPPEHVAALFKSVISQYAGYFRSIHFAIIDDHNTGNHLNPKGNFLPFQKELDGKTFHPQNLLSVNMASGPFRLLNKVGSDGQLDLSDVHIFELIPCKYGAQCHDLYDDQHIKSFSHPPICPNQSACKNTDDNVHMFSFVHRTKCRDGGECKKITDEQHLHHYEHPETCPQGGACTNTSPEHLLAYLHLPLCPRGLTCMHYLAHEYAHLRAYRHCRKKCSHENFCANFHDEQHLQDFDHSFPKPCPFTPFHSETPLMSSPDYHESYSYLTNHHPLKHSIISRQAKYKKGSCHFYRGCNTDDYLTFCLKIEYSKGQVSLSHAGPNSIYNHEVITAEFAKDELDLAELNFVHVSAGNGTVPVKNMVIRHEPIDDLHPSLDTKFVKTGATPSSTPSASLDSKAPPTTPDPKKEGVLAKIVHVVWPHSPSPKLKQCLYSVNCLERESPDHNSKYSHPCRYAELCRNIQNEPHLTHAPHKVPKCRYDGGCRALEDPVHRASYRHSNMADFFIPCRYQRECWDKSPKHRQMYSHGEQVRVPDNPSSD